MIIDVHTQLWSSPDQLGRELAERLRARQATPAYTGRPDLLDAGAAAHEEGTSCVDLSLVFGFRSERLGAHVPNDFVAEFVSRDSRRRAGVAGLDPVSPSALDQLDAAIAMGFIGVSISPSGQGFHPMHSDALAIYERCEAAGLPIFFTMLDPLPSSAMLEFAKPVLLDEVARTFPNLRMVVNQLGYPWIDETLTLIGKHPRVYADISGVASRPWQLYNALITALNLGVMGQILFASGFPRETPAGAIEALYSINSICQGTNMPTIPRSQVRGIIERNALTCLGLGVESRPSSGRAQAAHPVTNGSADPGAATPAGPSRVATAVSSANGL